MSGAQQGKDAREVSADQVFLLFGGRGRVDRLSASEAKEAATW